MIHWRKISSHIAVFSLATVVVVSYQNCSQSGFTTSSEELASSNNDSQGGGAPSIGDNEQGPNPGSQAIIFSDVANGSAKFSFLRTATIYGKASGFGSSNTWGCAEAISGSECSNPTSTSWIKLPAPDNDWTYDAATGDWRMATDFADVPAGKYRVGFLDRSATAISNEPKFIEVELRDPVSLTMSKTLNGPPVNNFKSNEIGYFKLSGMGDSNVWGCAEPAGSGGCVESAYQQYPVNGWTYNASDKTWRATIKMSDFPAGVYNLYAKDRTRNLQLTSSVTIYPAVLQCAWDPGFVIGPCDYNAQSLGLGSCSSANKGQVKSHANTCGSTQSTCSCN